MTKKNSTLFLLSAMVLSAIGLSANKNNAKVEPKNEPNIEIPDAIADNTTVDDAPAVNVENNTNLYIPSFASRYFFNLKDNFGYNRDGSCGYVSTAMLLNYWDTYWDDNIVPEDYEVRTIANGSNIDYSLASPGGRREASSLFARGLTKEEYYNNVVENSDTYFHFHMIKIGIDEPSMSVSPGNYGCFQSYYTTMLNAYLQGERHYSTSDYTIVAGTSNPRQNAISYVKRGIPVRLSISSSSGGHSVIAYDYDEDTDKLYCHFGWGASTTHATPESQGYTAYTGYTVLDFNTEENVGDNYFKYDPYGREIKVHPQIAIQPTTLFQISDYISDVPVIFTDSLINEKWYAGTNTGFHILVRNEAGNELGDFISYSNLFEIPEEIYERIMASSGTTYNIYYYTIGPKFNPLNWYCGTKVINKPHLVASPVTLNVNELKWTNQYFFDAKTTTHTKGDYTITANRLRCGIQNSKYITLSPRRAEAGKAYVEFIFNKAIRSYNMPIAMWSSSESLNGSVFIQIKTASGEWVTVSTLNVNSLPVKENGYQNFTYTSNNAFYGVRLEANAKASGSSNKGRIVVSDVTFNSNNAAL